MTIDLPPELEQYVAEKVGSGAYASASDLVRECLLLKQEEEARETERLRKLVAEADDDIANGRVGPCDPMATLEEVFAYLEAEQARGS